MLYIHDHMRKNNMHEAAKIFAEEANLELNPGQYFNYYFSLIQHFM